MPEHFHYTEEEILNPETHHEKSDVNVRALIWFTVIFVVLAVITHFTLWFLFKGFASMERDRARREAPLTGVPRPADASVPQDQPLLQPFPRQDPRGEVLPPNRNTPVTDLIDMRRAEEEALSSYGWIDRQKGTVRIPIEEAKRLVLQRGLPLQQTPAQQTPAGTQTAPARPPSAPQGGTP